ncbi:MAG: phytanoyl-CoA dioxygenase family protein [Candidatus Melainabacteria bacterium]
MTGNCSRRDSAWLEIALQTLAQDGYVVLGGVLDAGTIAATRNAMYAVQEAIRRDIGPDRLTRAGEVGVLRLMMQYDRHFLRFLELPELLAVVDATVSPTAIMHLQNGFILPSQNGSAALFQGKLHRDFPRLMNGYLASVNCYLTIDDFSEDNGATWVIPGSHQTEAPIDPATNTVTDESLGDLLRERGVPVVCPAGSLIVFDSTLLHAAGVNQSGADRLSVNHQFTRSFIKQQLDYPRALTAQYGQGWEQALPERTQQLLGYFSRPPESLDAYYQPEEKRWYRRGQG